MVYDVMIHDLDILLALVDAPVTDIKAMGIPVMTDKVDIAQARIEFATGTVANLTASRVSTERVRKMRFFQEHEYISLDFTRQDVLRVRVRQSPAGMPERVASRRHPAGNQFREASDNPGRAPAGGASVVRAIGANAQAPNRRWRGRPARPGAGRPA